jgi:hypothetical protein
MSGVCHDRLIAAEEVQMTLGGGPDDSFLIGPFLDWWEKRNTKRDAKRSAKAEAKAARHARSADDPPPST